MSILNCEKILKFRMVSPFFDRSPANRKMGDKI